MSRAGPVSLRPGSRQRQRREPARRNRCGTAGNPSRKPPSRSPSLSNRSGGGGRPKRRFPFRKVADLEEEILHRESRVQELTEELAQEATYRDGNRVRDVKNLLAQEQDSLKTLYEHWSEATR